MAIAKGTLIMTKDGWTPVGKVTLNDFACTHMNRFAKTTVKKVTGNKTGVTLYIKSLPGIRVSDDSMLYVLQPDGTFGFSPVSEVQEGTMVPVLKNTEECKSTLTPEMASLLGLYCAFGKVFKKNRVQIEFAIPKKTDISLPWDSNDISAPDDRLAVYPVPSDITTFLCLHATTNDLRRYIPNLTLAPAELCRHFIDAYSLTNKRKVFSFKNKDDAFTFASILEKTTGCKSAIKFAKDRFYVNTDRKTEVKDDFYLCPLEQKVVSKEPENMYRLSTDKDFSVVAGGIIVKG